MGGAVAIIYKDVKEVGILVNKMTFLERFLVDD